MSSSVTDKNNQPIQVGDEVWTKIRGGKHEGTADKIVMTNEEAQKEGVKNPPKVSSGFTPTMMSLIGLLEGCGAQQKEWNG